MATVREEIEKLKALERSGHGSDLIHIVNHTEDRKTRAVNPKATTRVTFEAYSPQSYSAIHAQKSRFIDAAGDPSIGVLLMIRALEQVSDAELHRWAQDKPEAGPGPEPADIPEEYLL